MADEAEFYVDADSGLVVRREAVGCTIVCDASDGPDGSSEQIASALNRLPQAELLIIRMAQAIRGDDADELRAAADAAEEWMVNG